jgi:hypothetical protein
VCHPAKQEVFSICLLNRLSIDIAGGRPGLCQAMPHAADDAASNPSHAEQFLTPHVSARGCPFFISSLLGAGDIRSRRSEEWTCESGPYHPVFGANQPINNARVSG